jgi:hypothetical protein
MFQEKVLPRQLSLSKLKKKSMASTGELSESAAFGSGSLSQSALFSPSLMPPSNGPGAGNDSAQELPRAKINRKSFRYGSFAAFQSQDEKPRRMLVPTVDRHMELPPPKIIGPFRAVLDMLSCKDRSASRSGVGEDGRTQTVLVVSRLFQSFLALWVIYCGIVLFILPQSSRQAVWMAQVPTWTGGELSPLEVLVPLVTFLMNLVPLVLAQMYRIPLNNYTSFQALHPKLLGALQKRTLVLTRDGVQRLEKINNFGYYVSNQAVQELRGTSFAGRPDLVASDLYASYLNSMASVHSGKMYRYPKIFIPLVTGLLFAPAACIPRLVYGGSLWADGSVEAFLLVFLGPMLTFISIFGVTHMILLHCEVLNFHYERLRYLTFAMPDPGQDMKNWENWPQMAFDSLLNIMTWHRLRWAFTFPPAALYDWGKLILEGVSLIGTAYLIFAVVWILIQGRQSPLLDSIFAVGVVTALTMVPLVLFTLSLALQTNQLLKGHVSAICRVMLTSMQSDTQFASNGQSALKAFDSETPGKMREIRHVLRELATALPLQTKLLTFFTFPVLPPGLISVVVLMIVLIVLLLLRFLFGTVL